MNQKVYLEVTLDVPEWDEEHVLKVIKGRVGTKGSFETTTLISHENQKVCEEGAAIGKEVNNYSGNLGHKEGRQLTTKAKEHVQDCEICSYHGGRHYRNWSSDSYLAMIESFRRIPSDAMEMAERIFKQKILDHWHDLAYKDGFSQDEILALAADPNIPITEIMEIDIREDTKVSDSLASFCDIMIYRQLFFPAANNETD